MKTCACETDISRDGSGRLGRFLQALDPAYNPVDNRSLSDLLVFAKRFASQVRFYKLGNDNCEANGSWKEFFDQDVAVLASSVLTADLAQIEKDYLETRAHFDQVRNVDAFKALFCPITGIAERLDKWLSRSSIDFALYADIQLAIRSSMREQMLKVFELDKAAVLVNSDELGIEFEPANEETWDLDVTIPFIGSLYAGLTLEDKLFNASLSVDTIFNASLQTLRQIVSKGEDYLYSAIEKYPRHQPHLALFIAFLELFRLAQQQLNGLTEKHLNFYYRDVLRVKEKAAQPDHVNLIFELAKDATAYHMPKGTALSAGKDARGIDQVYLTDRDMVINKAQVKEVKNVFIAQCGAGRIKGFYARPVADSADGKGAPLRKENPWWNPYGADEVKNQNACGQVINHTGRNYANVGFAIASPQLRMEGGDRRISLKMKGISKILTRSEDFYLKLSGAKGWIDIRESIEEPNGSVIFLMSHNIKTATQPSYYMSRNDPDMMVIFLPKTEQAVVGYNPELHEKMPFATDQPVLQILLNGNDVSISPEDWENTVVDFSTQKPDPAGSIIPNFQLGVIVQGLKKAVVVQNEQGVQPSDKPFYPFTPLPTPGSPLYIGSEEMFNKPLQSFTIDLEWQNKDIPFDDLQYSVLSGKEWVSVTGESNTFSFAQPAERQTAYFEEWNESLNQGFVKIVFNDLIKTNPAEMMQAGNRSKINSVSLGYTSGITQLDENLDKFFHIYPFGVVETVQENDVQSIGNEASRLGISFSGAISQQKVWVGNRIFPDFKAGEQQAVIPAGLDVEVDSKKYSSMADFEEKRTTVLNRSSRALSASQKDNAFSLDSVSVTGPNQYTAAKRQEGLLMIGLEGLVAPQNLSLLFQVAEGTAIDDDLDPPVIHWSYLSANQWKTLPASNVILDGTYGLQTTGILLLDVPEDATNNNTIMTPGLHWISASVDEGSHRLPYLVKITTQAVPAVFADHQNDPAHYTAPLPAGSVSKFLEKPSEIKLVDQPFESYNGVPAEIGKEFYMRVSERIRHKNRAVTAIDYEKIVLEYFPDIFKVKCITHTDPNCLCRDTETTETNDCQAKPVIQVTLNDNRALQIQGTVVDADDKSPLTGASLSVLGTTMGTTGADGKFAINPNTENTSLKVTMAGYQEQEVRLSRTTQNTEIKLQKEKKAVVCCGPQVAPGHVLVVPVADLKNRNAVNILQPRTSFRVLREIENMLKKRTSPFVKIHARNPVYEEILTAFRVQFKHGLDKGYFLTKLNEDIKQYLTPWVFDARADVVFGGEIYASSVINFIEERPYVEFITDFMMYQVICDCCGMEALIDEVKAKALRAKEVADQLLAEQIKIDPTDTKVNLLEVGKIINLENHPAGFINGDASSIWDFLRDESESMVEWIIRNVLSWFEISQDVALQTATNKYEQQLVMKVVEWYINLVKGMGLKTVEDLLKYLPVFKMVTLAEPTNARSIMVSARQHIIMLYEAEPVTGPCEKNKLKAKA